MTKEDKKHEGASAQEIRWTSSDEIAGGVPWEDVFPDSGEKLAASQIEDLVALSRKDRIASVAMLAHFCDLAHGEQEIPKALAGEVGRRLSLILEGGPPFSALGLAKKSGGQPASAGLPLDKILLVLAYEQLLEEGFTKTKAKLALRTAAAVSESTLKRTLKDGESPEVQEDSPAADVARGNAFPGVRLSAEIDVLAGKPAQLYALLLAKMEYKKFDPAEHSRAVQLFCLEEDRRRDMEWRVLSENLRREYGWDGVDPPPLIGPRLEEFYPGGAAAKEKRSDIAELARWFFEDGYRPMEPICEELGIEPDALKKAELPKEYSEFQTRTDAGLYLSKRGWKGKRVLLRRIHDDFL